ncbi:Midasin [Frankliniella fusca]|uniref:Midasin n=1 Tax=Frankliniella fusca TaxID=407009 RepID=A0AAE1HYC8_9NEOP|nr:Midasin [Frankliniella fusca]
MLNIAVGLCAWQHLEYLLGSTARRGRPKRDDPSLKAAAHLVMDRSYTLRQAALQFQIPPTTLRNYMKRPPKIETSRTPPVEIDLDSEPDQEAGVSREISKKGQVGTLPGNEVEEVDDDEQEEEVEEDEEEEEEEEEAGSVGASNVKSTSEEITETPGEDESGSESDSEDSDQDNPGPSMPPGSSMMWPDGMQSRGRRRPHNIALIQLCLREISNGTSVNAVAKTYGIPRTTLLYHMKRHGILSPMDRHGSAIKPAVCDSTSLCAGRRPDMHQQMLPHGLAHGGHGGGHGLGGMHGHAGLGGVPGVPVESVLSTPTFSAGDFDHDHQAAGRMNMGIGMGMMGMGGVAGPGAAGGPLGGNLGSPGKARIRRSEEQLRQAADCVVEGSTFQTVSDRFGIPISTIRFYMARRGILPQRRRGRSSAASGAGAGAPNNQSLSAVNPFHQMP